MDLSQIIEVLSGGLEALQEYVAYHVVTCLVPAFLLAGAIAVFLSRDAIIRYLGLEARRLVSYPLAAVSSLGLAVCSCTVIPIASGLYKRGSSVGTAFIFLWVAPAANILALTYTGAILGADMAIVRALVALTSAFIVGLVMSSVFKKEEITRSKSSLIDGAKSSVVRGRRGIVLIAMLIVTLLMPNYLGELIPGYLFKLSVFAILFAVTMSYALAFIDRDEVKAWLHETLWFVRLIFPLLLVGAFAVGVVGKLLPKEWVETWLGGNGLLQTFIACLIGAVSYFATLTEAPFVSMLMSLGMGKGPALALLLTGPGMSLPNMLAIIRIFKFKKAIVYILTTIAIATLMSFAISNIIWST